MKRHLSEADLFMTAILSEVPVGHEQERQLQLTFENIRDAAQYIDLAIYNPKQECIQYVRDNVLTQSPEDWHKNIHLLCTGDVTPEEILGMI